MVRELEGRKVIDVNDSGDDAISGQAEDVTALTDDLDLQLNSIAAEFGADDRDVRFMLKVYQVIPQTGKLKYLFTVTPAELPIMDRLRDEHGGGDFEIRVYKNSKLYRKLTECIGAPASRPMTVPKDNTDAVAQGFNKLAELLAQRQQPQQQMNMLEMMTGFAALLTAIKPVLSSPAAPAAPQRDPIELLMRGMEMANVAREMAGDGGTGSTMMDILRDVVKGAAPAIGQLMLAQQNGQAVAMPAGASMSLPMMQAAPNVPAAPPAANSAKPAPEGQPPMMQSVQNVVLKKYVSMLVKKASEEANPELYAEFILDNVPYETIKKYLEKPDLAGELAKFDGNVNRFKPWFAELETVIRQMVIDAENDSAPDLTGEGDPLETGEHATSPGPFDPDADS